MTRRTKTSSTATCEAAAAVTCRHNGKLNEDDLRARIQHHQDAIAALRACAWQQVLHEISVVFESEEFYAGDVWDAAARRSGLRDALMQANILNVRCLGKRLQAMAGRPCGPWFLERLLRDRDGGRWRLRVCDSA